MKEEKLKKAISGYPVLFLLLAAIGLTVWLTIIFTQPLFILSVILYVFVIIGFITVDPNESKVFVLFGKYDGTIKDNGFFWVNPFYVRKTISLRARNFESEPIKVNDKVGNPIMIGQVLVWKVENTFKAAFEVDEYERFVRVQSDAALRKLSGMFPYDNFDHTDLHELTLRGGGEEVNQMLENEISERLQMAGIKVIESRINHIAYSAEIAQAMLKRQQATAIVAAREKIVEGAVGMVQLALKQLSEKQIIELDSERKAAMVSNLLVVLCSDESARPVVNAGTLYQ